jgi:poly-beta-1,6-N-acetyl-D-glucosamine synthase
MLEFIFWFSVLFVVYTYFGYPLLLFLLARIKPRSINKQEQSPMVSVVIAARNEEANIKGRLDDLLRQDFLADIEIFVI